MRSSPNVPDPDLCRTQRVVNDFWECVVEQTSQAAFCRYALEFGFSRFCRHPDNKAFGSRVGVRKN